MSALAIDWGALHTRAVEMTTRSYAPYSHFKVGAAVRGECAWPYPLARDLALHTLLLDALDAAVKETPCP